VVGEPKVVEAKLTFAQDLFDFTCMKYGGSAYATLALDDGSTQHFGWFHDELTYVKADFVGKTMQEIADMHRERDLAYLRS
jgi:hypothetical protein